MPSYFSYPGKYDDALTHVSQRRRVTAEKGKAGHAQRGNDEFLQRVLAHRSNDLQTGPGSVQSGLVVS